jgi:hypothetical protein
MNHSKISDLIEKISAKLKKDGAQNLPKIELDLVMQQMRELYDELDALKNTGNQQAQQDRVKHARTNLQGLQPEELIIQQKLLPNEHLLLGDFGEKQSLQNQTVKAEKKSVEAEKVAAVNPAVANQRLEKVTSINESIQHPGSLNEKLKSAGKEVHKKLASKPLKDLIDLNHRFTLLNELFKGNSEAFSTAISHIDQLADYDSASSFIKTQLAANYYWDESSQSTLLFVKLVKQKFGVE